MENTVRLITPQRHGDDRGWFTETYSEPVFSAMGIDCRFVQDNHSLSSPQYTLRGLHFQAPPYAQAKLVRCLRGTIFDVAIDLRQSSPSYGQWAGYELSAGNGRQLFIPIGFAHGFVTLEADCEVAYKCSATYSPEHAHGLHWADPDIAIAWPIPDGVKPILSDRDDRLPPLAELVSPFTYEPTTLAACS